MQENKSTQLPTGLAFLAGVGLGVIFYNVTKLASWLIN